MRLISGCLQPTQLSWLPVLSNVAPSSLHRKAATENMLQITEAHPNSPVRADVFEHPPARLAPRCPIWSDMTSVNTTAKWREDCSTTSVVNHAVVTNPTNRQPGFNLPRHTWSLMNRFWTGESPCRANLHKWGLTQSHSCDYGQQQTVNHIVYMCQLTKFECGPNLLHKVDDDAVVIWLESTATAAFVKKNSASVTGNCTTMFYNTCLQL